MPEPRRWTIHVCPFCDGAHAGDGSVPKACSYTHMGGIGMPEGAGPPEQVEVVEARLTKHHISALVHAAGYVLHQTDPAVYRYLRDDLRDAQLILDRELGSIDSREENRA